MASLLATLGLTNTAAPDPSAYTNIQAEASNLTSAKSGLSDTITNIGLALNSADLLGIDPTYTNTLKSLQAQATTTLNSNMTSAQIATQAESLNNKLQAAKGQQVEAVKKEAIAALTTATKTVSDRVAVVRADKTTSVALLAKYNKLLADANAALAEAKKPASSGSAGSGSGSGSTPAIVYQTPDDLLATLDDLDAEKDAEENKEFNWQRFFKKILRITMLGLSYVTVIFGLLLGGIATSNAYASDYFWAIKLFYFIYGAIGFPITLCMAVVYKPYWVSGLIPLKSLVPRKVPVLGASGAYTAASAAVSAAASTPTASSTNLPTSAQGLLNQAGSLFGLSGGGSGPSMASPSAPGSATISLSSSGVTPSLSFTDKLFGYLLVDDKNPTDAQKSSQNILRILSIVDLALLSAVGIYYGVDKLLLKNQL
jgi:hypothetical protein